MTDDERNALANMKNAEAIEKLIEVVEAALVLPNADAEKLYAAERLAADAKQIAAGVDRGSLKGTIKP